MRIRASARETPENQARESARFSGGETGAQGLEP
jgi:hypothetical protein